MPEALMVIQSREGILMQTLQRIHTYIVLLTIIDCIWESSFTKQAMYLYEES